MPDNTSIVVIDKPLSMLQRKILEADLTNQYTSQTALAKAVGCDRQSVVKAQQLSTYIDSYNSAKALDKAKGINLKKHTITELKVAMTELQRLVSEDKSLQAYGAYVKLLIDVAKGTAEVELDQEEETIDTNAIRNDLLALIDAALTRKVSPATLVDGYINTGIVPKSNVYNTKRIAPANEPAGGQSDNQGQD